MFTIAGILLLLLYMTKPVETGVFREFDELSSLSDKTIIEEGFSIYISGRSINILAKDYSRVFTLHMETSFEDYKVKEVSKGKIDRYIKADNEVNPDDYYFITDGFGLLIKNNGAVRLYTGNTEKNRVEGQVRLVSFIADLNKAIEVYNKVLPEHADKQKLFSTDYSCIVVDNEELIYYVYTLDGEILAIPMAEGININEDINIVDSLRSASNISLSTLDISQLSNSKGRQFDFIVPLDNDFTLGLSVDGSQFLYDNLRSTYEFLIIN